MSAIILGILLALSATDIGWQPDSVSSYPVVHKISVESGIDYVASSVEDEIREKFPKDEMSIIHTSIPVHLKYAFSFTNPAIRNYYPGGYQGIGISVLNYGGGEPHGISCSEKNIGYPVVAYIFQGGPILKLRQNFSFDYEWNFGASFGWKPYSLANEKFNLTVGSKVNAYLNLTLGIRWQITPRIGVFGGLSVSHFSNGNTSWPNPGINSIGMRVGLNYIINPQKKGFSPVDIDTVRKRKLEYDITLWGASRKRLFRGIDPPVLLKGHFACAGVSFAPMFRLSRWWRLGGSADLQYDHSSDLKRYYLSGTDSDDIKFRHQSFFRQLTFGISAHGELQMPIFAVNVGIGYNIFSPWENRGFYQNITLKTYVCDKIFLNVGYQLRNFHQQSSLMLGLGVTV